MSKEDSREWLEAMKSELQSMEDNQVWDLVDLPDRIKSIKNKWVFKRKTDMDGNLTVYKAHLVVKGFTQVEGIDYDENFSPVAKFQSIRILLAIAIFYDYKIWQMDVKITFLNVGYGKTFTVLVVLTQAPGTTSSPLF
jgi:Reverse transcriptase (RNA-dependent DNA polymerase)